MSRVVLRRSTNILPYYKVGRAILRSNRARMAVSAARFAIQNRKAIYRMGRGALKRVGAWRSSRAAKRRRFQADRAAGPSNIQFYDNTGSLGLPSSTITLKRRTLYSAVIEFAKAPSSTELLGQASRNQIKLKGLKVCFNGELLSFNSQDACQVHLALVQPKSQDTSVSPFDLNSFFSRPGGGNAGADRTKNFVNAAGTTPVDFEYNCLGINTSKWNVVTHVRKLIVPKGSNFPEGKNIFKYDKYINLKGKRVMWDATGSVFTNRPMILLVWWERNTSDDPSATVDFLFNVNTVTYFSDAV